VATAAGALGTLAPWALAVSIVVFAFMVWATRYVSLGSICAVAVFPVLLFAARLSGWPAPVAAPIVSAAAAVACLIVLKHAGNIRRLRAGTERRLGQPRATA